MAPEFDLPVDEEQYEKAGSKFITFPPGNPKDQVGDVEYREVECGMVDWETPGQSMKLPITVVEEGPDSGKEEKISFGVDAKGIWKGKEIYENVTGKPMPMRQGQDGKNHPFIDPMELVTKHALGMWQMTSGYPGGDTSQPKTYYPKLVSVLPLGQRPEVQDAGIG